jgi:RimJ/RimL family protein N-acetyltransferase
MRITPEHGVIEIGSILWGPRIAKTRIATEALYLFARYALDDLGYRRFEWKCDAENAPSRRAAERFGFTFEGIFREHMVVKGRNRDTAWFAIVDRDWPAIRAAMERWLAPGNFDADGKQRQRLKDMIAAPA